jgi:ferredoxin-NADP reductase/Na+-translocating ferredoxin:NAD+ oxidoreductase RnfD subunit
MHHVFKITKHPIVLALQNFIDATTMYRVVLYALLGLTATSLLFGIMGIIPQTFLEQVRSLVVVLLVAFVVNEMCARLWRAHTNYESVAITALIVFFLVSPARDLYMLHVIALAVIIAMVSKYLLAWRGQHCANPAAIGILALSLAGYYESTWWIGAPPLFVPLVMLGAMVVYKIRKWEMVLSFLGVAFVVFLYEEWQFFGTLEGWSMFFISYPALFLAFFMLTEPFTTPPTKKLQAVYGALVGFVSSTTLLQPLVKMSPELALVIGNGVMYPFTLKRKLFLKYISRTEIAPHTYEYVFEKPTGLHFKAGQYLEWMLPHRGADKRGVRRYFTIASSPTESVIRLALKIPVSGSSYKAALTRMQSGDTLIASQLAGDFLLPTDPAKKIGMIAGGIGVTPFRSHVQYMLDTPEARHDSIIFYCVPKLADGAYRDVFVQAAVELPLRLVTVVDDPAVTLDSGVEQGFIDEAMLKRNAPDYRERTWYISGPPRMVDAYTALLVRAGVPRRQIVRDFFPGLA